MNQNGKVKISSPACRQTGPNQCKIMHSTAFRQARFTKLLLVLKSACRFSDAGQKQLIMSAKMTALFLLAFFLQVSARTTAQVTLKERSASLEKVIAKIKQQSGYGFVYDDAMLRAKARPVQVDVTNVPVEKALEKVFKGQDNLTYSLNGKIISVKEKPEKKLDPVTEGLNPRLDPIPPPTDVTITVLNTDGQPLEGASIIIKGQNKGIATDINGRASLRGIDPNAIVVISFTGYVNQEYKLSTNPGLKSGATNLTALIRLAVSTSELDEIQIGAYSKTSKRLQTGNVTTVKGEDIQKQPVSNPLLALQGRVPGLVVTQNTGIAGGGVTVRVQGQNSITGGNDPLYVIDGVPYVSQMLITTTGGPTGILQRSGGTVGGITATGYGNPLNYINPNDIESIEVLKDADATSIYGSRAANGAILITTKKGKAGETKFDINLQQGWGKVPLSNLQMMNTQQYLQMRKEALKNDNVVILRTDANYDVNGLWDTTRYTDWRKVFLGGTALYTNMNGSVSGGSANTQYLVGGSYHRETTVFPGDFADQKAGIHFSITSFSTNRKFRLQITGSYLSDNNQLSTNDFTQDAYVTAPDAPALYNPDGSLNWAPNLAGNSSWTNPLSNLTNTYQNKTDNLYSNAILSYKILPSLEFSSKVGYTKLQTNEFAANPILSTRPEFRSGGGRNAFYTNSESEIILIEPQLTFNRPIGKSGKLDAIAGISVQQTKGNGQSLSASGFVSDDLMKDIRSASTITINSTAAFIYKYNGGYGRLNYNLLNKYIVNLSARRDGSSRFGRENQFHDFYSAATAWIFSDERLFKKALTFISFGKLKVSYGTSGNDQIGDYTFMDLYSSNTPVVPYQGSNGSLVVTGIANPYLQWEETSKLAVGMDLGFLKDRILLSATYGRNRSSNELLGTPLPSMTGFTSVSRNFPATVQNRSWEFTLTTMNFKTKAFSWNSSLNLTIPQNKLIDFPNLSTSTFASTLVIGQSISIVKAYHFLGVDPTTGAYMIADSHGNPTVNPNSTADKTVLINTLPKFYGGFQNSFSYKGFRFDILFQFVSQLSKNPSLFGLGSSAPGTNNVNQMILFLNHWQKPGDISEYARYNSNFALNISNAGLLSDISYRDGLFARLKNLAFSYELPDKWKQKAGLQDCSLFIQGQNLFTITNYKGPDPESNGFLTLPPLKVLTVGLKVRL